MNKEQKTEVPIISERELSTIVGGDIRPPSKPWNDISKWIGGLFH